VTADGAQRGTIRDRAMRSSSSASVQTANTLFSAVETRPSKLWDIGSSKATSAFKFPPGALVDSLIVARDGRRCCGLRRWPGPRLGRNSTASPSQPGLAAGLFHWPSIATAGPGQRRSQKTSSCGTWPREGTGHAVRTHMPVQAVRFSPDGKTVASAEGSWPKSPAGCGEALDVATARKRATLRGHGHGIFAVAFSPVW